MCDAGGKTASKQPLKSVFDVPLSTGNVHNCMQNDLDILGGTRYTPAFNGVICRVDFAKSRARILAKGVSHDSTSLLAGDSWSLPFGPLGQGVFWTNKCSRGPVEWNSARPERRDDR